MDSYNLQNIIDGQAVSISITGMAIVFSGLLLISLYIAFLPVILNLITPTPDKRKPVSKKPEAETVVKKSTPAASLPSQPAEPAEDDSHDIASVIGLVLQLEQERFSKTDNEQITLSRNSQQTSMWGKAGRMRKLPQRRTHA